MNCVNAEFTGGDSSEMSSFPAMFVANLASVDKCPTTESINVDFPRPGSYVTTKMENDPYPLATPSGEGCSAGAAPPYASVQHSPPPASHATAARPTTTPLPVSTPIPFHTATPTQTLAATPKPSLEQPVGKCTGNTVPCPEPGLIICVDSAQFGICDTDFCALPVAVAPGTLCSNGIISRKVKRSLGDHNSPFHHHQHAAKRM